MGLRSSKLAAGEPEPFGLGRVTHQRNIANCYNEVMRSEWHKFNPKDSRTHPRDNSRVEMRDADGTQFAGGFLAGRFVSGGVTSANAASAPKHWRYAT
jgi:hypothetical protein